MNENGVGTYGWQPKVGELLLVIVLFILLVLLLSYLWI